MPNYAISYELVHTFALSLYVPCRFVPIYVAEWISKRISKMPVWDIFKSLIVSITFKASKKDN